MAKKRDIIVGIIIAVVFLGAFGFMGVMFIGLVGGSDGVGLGLSGLSGNIGLVEVSGGIYESNGRKVIEQLEDWADNSSIKAIVVHVNSPGGGVAISQEIYDTMNRIRDYSGKPIVVSMASVAASGGYYIACAADRVVANPGTITGSIGVIFQFNTFGDLMEKVGVETETIKSGELKDVGNMSRRMTEKEELMLRSVVMDTYEQFVHVVAEGRGKDPEEIYPLADGSIYTGLQAYNLGLVDTLGGLNEAVEIAAQLADMSVEPKVARFYERKQVGLFDLLGKLDGLLDKAQSIKSESPELKYLFAY
ncbi:MAG: signal peptide peptidase SppA [Calditrichaeota bacterium]|nr:MAG: signal peptide peptidase SppA [Calditrichota bacterium]